MGCWVLFFGIWEVGGCQFFRFRFWGEGGLSFSELGAVGRVGQSIFFNMWEGGGVLVFLNLGSSSLLFGLIELRSVFTEIGRLL